MRHLLFTFPAAGRRARRRRGFMLVDAVLALILTGMMVVCGLSLMTASSSATNASRQTTVAYNAARQAIENVRSLHGAKIPCPYNGGLIGSMPQLAQLDNGTGALRIATYRDPVKMVTATITFRSGRSRRNQTVALTTLVGPGGVTP